MVERPNGKPACITTNMAEKMKWNLVYHRTEWMLEEYPISIKLNNLGVSIQTSTDSSNVELLSICSVSVTIL